MARPKKNLAEKHSCVLPPIRCTEAERESIKNKANKLGVSMSAYVRHISLNGKITVQKSKYDFDLINQIRKIGVNINQQTKRLNGTGEVSPELQSLWKKLDLVLDEIISTG